MTLIGHKYPKQQQWSEKDQGPEQVATFRTEEIFSSF
jgi:hypothetical protein